eukprot:jgi/Chlat1/4104/Chrsp26S04135
MSSAAAQALVQSLRAEPRPFLSGSTFTAASRPQPLRPCSPCTKQTPVVCASKQQKRGSKGTQSRSQGAVVSQATVPTAISKPPAQPSTNGVSHNAPASQTSANAIAVQTTIAEPASAAPAGTKLEDLMDMIKAAEKNIMLLHNARLKSEAALEEASRDKSLLEGQVQVFQKRVDEMEEERVAMEELLQQYANKLDGEVTLQTASLPVAFWSSLLVRLDDLFMKRLLSKDEHASLRLLAWARDQRMGKAFSALLDVQDDKELRDGIIDLVNIPRRPGLHVVHIAAEMAPVAKVGGLGDVVTGLGRAHQKKGHMVEVILPKYDCMDYSQIKDLKDTGYEFTSYFDGGWHNNKVWRGLVDDLAVFFIEPLHTGGFFWRKTFYGEADDFSRFSYFSRAALEFLYRVGKRPDIIHMHDWQTAAVAPLYWDVYAPQGWDSSRLVLTCHNYEFQGTEQPNSLRLIGLDPFHYNRMDRLQDNYMHNKINLLKGGIVYSNAVTTVSPTYAVESRTPEGGRGLHNTLLQQGGKFYGILNGIDNDVWNPETDPLLTSHYNYENTANKQLCKRDLKKMLRLADDGVDGRRPLVCAVSRLVQQKGVHLIRHAIYRTLELGGQFVLLGSTHDPAIKKEFDQLARDFEHNTHARLLIKYDETLAHRIYAGADIFVIPSIFEPCGLTQLIAMRYGAIPVARKTGGLNDSVFDVDDQSLAPEDTNGFCFHQPNEHGLNSALDRAIQYYWERPEWWSQMVEQAMSMDFSWDRACEEYGDIYAAAVAAV